MEAILDHKRDGTAVPMADKFFNTKQGKLTQRHTTVGWSFLIKWKNGPKEWVNLKVLKESNPVDVAEYVTVRGIEQEPAFAWWVPYTLCKRDVILSYVYLLARIASHKYGIEISTSIASARKIDEKNGNDYLMTEINKEMTNIGIAFTILDNGFKAPPGWRKASGHLVFDVNM